jgi:GTPase SAR1 family protein
VGNKTDKIDARKVMLSEGQEISNTYKIPFYETSCKMNININDCFNKLVDKMLEQGNFRKLSKTQKLSKAKDIKKGCCA